MKTKGDQDASLFSWIIEYEESIRLNTSDNSVSLEKPLSGMDHLLRDKQLKAFALASTLVSENAMVSNAKN